MRYGLVNYLEHRIEPGGCLMAMLQNDLWRSIVYADPETRGTIVSIVLWLAQFAPFDSFGSIEKVADWLAERGR